jgi:predicted transcriptional regulator
MEFDEGSVSTISLRRREDVFDFAAEPKQKLLARRSQLEIWMDMLRAVKDGAEKPTQIMYKANLSWVALQTHLKLLLGNGLLEWANDGTRKRYVLTIKGTNVMSSYKKILEAVGQDPDSIFGFPHTFSH